MRIIFLAATIAFAFLSLGCPGGSENGTEANNQAGNSEIAGNVTDSSGGPAIESPMAAVKTFIEALRKKDEDGMRSALSEKSVEFFDKMAQERESTFYEVVVGDDLEEMSKMPEMKNEEINGDEATVEVRNQKTDKWDKIPFVKEGGNWKIALFDNSESEES